MNLAAPNVLSGQFRRGTTRLYALLTMAISAESADATRPRVRKPVISTFASKQGGSTWRGWRLSFDPRLEIARGHDRLPIGPRASVRHAQSPFLRLFRAARSE